ncbi:MAG: 50S ribosomal protein L6, partial [Ureaplasma sp.]|nr:50S ribosomal protein L6 [Ureaplasma sp.]
MSRIGNRILEIPSDVSIEVKSNVVVVKKGNESLEVIYPSKLIKVEQKENKLQVIRLDESKESNMFQGTV